MGSSITSRYLFSCRVLFLLLVCVSVSVSGSAVVQGRESNGEELLLLLGNSHGRRVLAKEPLEEEQVKKKATGIEISTSSDLQEKKQSKSNNSSSPLKPQQKKIVSSSNSSDPVKSMPVSSNKQKKPENKLTDLPRTGDSQNKTKEEKSGKITQIPDQKNAGNSAEKQIKKLTNLPRSGGSKNKTKEEKPGTIAQIPDQENAGNSAEKQIKKLTDVPRSGGSKNKTKEEKSGKITQILDQKNAGNKTPASEKNKVAKSDSEKKSKVPIPKPISDYEEPDDLIREFRDLPTKFQETVLLDLETISITSKTYFSRANQEITEGFKPLVGSKYAPFVASVTSYIFLILPLLLVSILFNHIKLYFSLQKILLLIQIYLAIYFTILSLTFLVTGIEPLRFFYSSSLSSYVYMQVLQTLAYVIYLLLQLLYLVVIFSDSGGVGSKVAGLVASVVASVVGLHYYSAVCHRAVLHKPPRTNWKIHGVYALGFAVVCVCARLDWRKKAYLQGGDDDKKS